MDHDGRADYVERWARVLESQGEPRIAGRIYAHLATADQPYLSLRELADELGVSRASVSTNTRRLISQGLLERVPVPGSRGEHYGLTRDPFGLVERIAQSVALLRDLSLEGVALQPGRVTPGTQSLRAMAEIYAQLAASLEELAPPVPQPVTPAS